eukprot:CAMPEP_0195060000 /NCGR_PEP_ID=MMETSP0448-20130528/7361_1 /TAXON_ID=66468 /ORGANISM="Heterocapsa triquestra, Strain CCMP 448" /LENGTH=354 /DNA_ID=CAMNT_0040090347 /DNA_START=198 /DNA_END=1258 /DNA_ORIENTATION=+
MASSQDAADAAEVDVPALIQAFLADESITELELPGSLTAEQRSQAKKLSQQHPELKCESYGFGAERRVHLFKKASQERVTVKNTFIDDWEGDANKEGAMFRSVPAGMPENLLERTLQRCLNGKADIKELATHPESVGSGSPRSPRTTKSADQFGNSPASSGQDLGAMPDGFKVRNTFIHIESVPVVERIVQSMPHGMFSKCLQEELSSQGTAQAPPAAAPVAAPAAAAAPPPAPVAAAPEGFSDPEALVPGTEVVIQGLIKLPDFNGLAGVVQSLDPESGRYDVLLDGPAGTCGWRWVKVKGENCRPRMPPPPSNAPTLSMDQVYGVPGAGEGGPGDFPATPHWEDGGCGVKSR